MTLKANDVETLHDFAFGVMARAGHNAIHARPVVLAILGGIIWRVDPGSIEIKINPGKLANALWWTSVLGKRYACGYNAQTGGVEILDRDTKGPALHTFNAAAPITEVERIFATL